MLLMITDGKKWYYLAVKSLPAFPRGITSNHNRDFYCLKCFHSYHIDNKLKNMKQYVLNMIIVIQKCLTNTAIH